MKAKELIFGLIIFGAVLYLWKKANTPKVIVVKSSIADDGTIETKTQTLEQAAAELDQPVTDQPPADEPSDTAIDKSDIAANTVLKPNMYEIFDSQKPVDFMFGNNSAAEEAYYHGGTRFGRQPIFTDLATPPPTPPPSQVSSILGNSVLGQTILNAN